MQYKTFRDAIVNIDWKLLQQQKKTLEKLLVDLPSNNNLWGLIEFIENLQDIHKVIHETR